MWLAPPKHSPCFAALVLTCSGTKSPLLDSSTGCCCATPFKSGWSSNGVSEAVAKPLPLSEEETTTCKYTEEHCQSERMLLGAAEVKDPVPLPLLLVFSRSSYLTSPAQRPTPQTQNHTDPN